MFENIIFHTLFNFIFSISEVNELIVKISSNSTVFNLINSKINVNKITVKENTLKNVLNSIKSNFLFNFSEFLNINSAISLFLIKNTESIFLNLNCSFIEKGYIKAFFSILTFNNFKIYNFTNFILYSEDTNAELIKGIVSNSFFKKIVKFGFYFRKSKKIIIDNCLFKEIKTWQFSALDVTINNEISILNSNFTLNKASKLNGGAIRLIDCQSTKIFKNNFLKNTGKKGGAIFLDCNLNRKCLNNFEINIFKENIAEIEGGGLKYLNSRIKNIDTINIFDKNKAKYSNDFASSPVRLGFTISNKTGDVIYSSFDKNNNKTEVFILKNQSTGKPFNKIIKIYMIDIHNQLIKEIKKNITISISLKIMTINDRNQFTKLINENKINEFYLKKDPILLGDQVLFHKENSFYFEFSKNMQLISTPTSYSFIKIESNHLWQNYKENDLNLNKNEMIINQTYSIIIPVLVKECDKGEIYINDSNICEKCPLKFYSLNKYDKTCLKCPLNAKCEGGSDIIVDEGYWRSSMNSNKIFECLRVFDSCAGGKESKCRSTYHGNLCFECRKIEDSFYQKTLSGECMKCQELGVVFFTFLALLFNIICVIYYLSYVMLSGKVLVIYKIFIKLFLVYIQFMVLIQTNDVSVIKFFNATLAKKYKMKSVSSFWYAFDCLVLYAFGSYSAYYQILIFSIMLYIVAFSIYLWIKFKENELKKNLGFYKRNIPIEFLFILYYCAAPPYLELLYGNQICIKIDTKYYLRYSPNMRCYSNTDIAWLLIFIYPSILIWGLLIPFLIYRYYKSLELYNNPPNIKSMNINNNEESDIIREKVESSEFTNFFLFGCEKKTFVWELILYIAKICMIVANQSRIGSRVSFPIVLVILIYTIAIILIFNPFLKGIYRFLMYNVLFTLCITSYCLAIVATDSVPLWVNIILILLMSSSHLYIYISLFLTTIVKYLEKVKGSNKYFRKINDFYEISDFYGVSLEHSLIREKKRGTTSINLTNAITARNSKSGHSHISRVNFDIPLEKI